MWLTSWCHSEVDPWLLGNKMPSLQLSILFCQIFMWNVVLFSDEFLGYCQTCVMWVHSDLWPPHSNQFVLESDWRSVPILKIMPRGVREIFWEWDGQMDRQHENIMPQLYHKLAVWVVLSTAAAVSFKETNMQQASVVAPYSVYTSKNGLYIGKEAFKTSGLVSYKRFASGFKNFFMQ